MLRKELPSTISWVFGTNRPGVELRSQSSPRPGKPEFNPKSCHTKDSKMVLDSVLLYTQHYNVRTKSKVEQSRWKKLRLLQHLDEVAIEKGAFGLASITVANFILFTVLILVSRIFLGLQKMYPNAVYSHDYLEEN